MIKKSLLRVFTIFVLFIFLVSGINAKSINHVHENNEAIIVDNNQNDSDVKIPNKDDEEYQEDQNANNENDGNDKENCEANNNDNNISNENDENSEKDDNKDNSGFDESENDQNINVKPPQGSSVVEEEIDDMEQTSSFDEEKNKNIENVNGVIYKQLLNTKQIKPQIKSNSVFLLNSVGIENVLKNINNKNFDTINKNIDKAIVVKSGDTLNLVDDRLMRDENYNDGPLFIVEKNAKLIMNNVKIDGKNIKVNSNAAVILNKGEVILNKTSIFNHNLVSNDKDQASMILNDGGKLEINDSKITDNDSVGKKSAGAILISNKAETNINNSKLNDNKGVMAGAIFINSGKLVLNKVQLANNYSLTDGGAINAFNEDGKKLEDAAVLEINQADIIKNHAKENGGAINLDQGSLAKINKVNILDNYANIDGGGIYIDDRYNSDKKALHNIPLELKNVVVTNNNANYYGAGMFLDYFAKVETYPTSGLAIYDNKTSLGGESVYMCNKEMSHYNINLNERILGGSKQSIFLDDFNRYDEWSNKLEYGKYPKDNEGKSNLLKLKPENVNNLEAYADILIKNNESGINGGGLAINGKVIFGENSSNKIKVEAVWQNKEHINYEYSRIKLDLVRTLDNEVVESVTLNKKDNFKYEFNNLPLEFKYEIRQTITNGNIDYQDTINRISKGNEETYIITYSEIK